MEKAIYSEEEFYKLLDENFEECLKIANKSILFNV